MRDELFFKHDLRSREDEKMDCFLERTGAAGYGVFWVIVEKLYYANTHRIPVNDQSYAAYARACRCTTAQVLEIINAAMEEKLFDTETINGNSFLFSRKVDSEVQDRETRQTEISKARSAASNVRWQKHNGKMQTNAPAMQNVQLDKRERERKENSARARGGSVPAAHATKPKTMLLAIQSMATRGMELEKALAVIPKKYHEVTRTGWETLVASGQPPSVEWLKEFETIERQDALTPPLPIEIRV